MHMDRPVKKLSLYLETSVWNFIFADDAPDKRDATKRFFKEIKEGRYEIYISNLVYDEIADTRGPKREQLEQLIREYSPTQVASNEKVQELVGAYLESGVVPKGSEEDAFHIAYAVSHNLDVVVSWNLKHIVRLKTRMLVNGINKLLGYKEIEIVTPEEVIGDGS